MDVGACLYGRNFIYHDFVYFNNTATSCGSVLHSGDNRTLLHVTARYCALLRVTTCDYALLRVTTCCYL